MASFEQQFQRLLSENAASVQKAEEYSRRLTAELEAKIHSLSEEMRLANVSLHTSSQTAHEKLLNQVQTQLGQSRSTSDGWRQTLDQRVNERLRSMEATLREELLSRQQVDQRMRSHCSNTESILHHEVEQLRRESQQGLQEVKQTLSTMQSLSDTRREALRREIKREIDRLLKTVVVV